MKFEVELRNFRKPYYYKGKKTRYDVTYSGEVYNRETGTKYSQISDSRSGYVHVSVSDKNAHLPTRTLAVHRMVAETFIPNPARFKVVNHLDNDRNNNRVDNLEWTTQSENLKYAYNQGRMHVLPKGEAHKDCKYSDAQIRQVCELLQAGYRNKDVAEMTGVPSGYISDIRKREWRKDISKDYEWETIAFKDRKGSKAYNATIDEKIAKRICKMIQDGKKNKEIADEMGIKRHIVKNIRARIAWRDVSCHYKW